MFVIDLEYIKNFEEIDALRPKHRELLQKYYDLGILLASGPKNPRTGGVIIALGAREIIEKMIQEDPFYINQCAEYKITEFEAVKHCEALKDLLK